MYSKNNSGKHYIPAHRRRVARRRKQQNFLIGVVAFFLSIISCVTLAYVFTRTEPVENTFDNAYVACDVLENGEDGTSPFDGNVKTNVRIKNTGEVQSYIRAAVVVTWMSSDENKVTARKPIESTDYEITYTADANWKKGSDGYWYYKVPVDVGIETANLIERCALKSGVAPPEGFYLSVEIVASSIQSTPTRVVTEQWDSGVSGVDGSTLIIK